MGDKRGHGNTGDTGSPAARARDDLRTASKGSKPKDQRAEGRDKDLKPSKDEESGKDTK